MLQIVILFAGPFYSQFDQFPPSRQAQGREGLGYL